MQQLTIFDFLDQENPIEETKKFKFTKPVRLIELFAGIGAQAKALENLGINFEHYRAVEFDKYAIKSYNAVHHTNFEVSDITKINAQDLGIVDTENYTYIMTYSFPCALAGTKVITNLGYKNIEDIRVGDSVLTHTNTFKKVSKTMRKISDHYYKIKGIGVPLLTLTEEHPLYVLRDGTKQWIKVKDLKTTDMFTFNNNTQCVNLPLNNKTLWLLGRYVADGYINKYLYNSTLFAIGKNKNSEWLENIPNEYILDFKCDKVKNGCSTYRLANKEFQKICLEFGNGSKNKKIPQWLIDAPKEQIKMFLKGYFSGDGIYRKRGNSTQIMFTTVSKELYLGLQQLIAKVYDKICSCSIRKDNRKETFSDTYNCQFNIVGGKRGQFFNENNIFTEIKSIERVNEDTPVYNIEVEEDNSYTCENVIVHNCQDLSLAGKQAGMQKGTGTRSGLLWEVERLLNECGGELPQVLLLENVPQLHSKKNIADFEKWISFLDAKGYKSYWKDLNAKNFGIPQNRNRTFMVSLLGNYSYEFPKEFPLKLRLKDMLEEEVDEKYYLSKKMIEYITNNNEKWTGNNDKSLVNKKLASTINTGEGSRRCDASNYICNDVEENFDLKNSQYSEYSMKKIKNNVVKEEENGKIIRVGKTRSGGERSEIISSKGIYSSLTATDYKQPKQILEDTDKLIQCATLSGGKWNKIYESARRVYDENGVAPTIPTCSGGNTEPKVGVHINEETPKVVGGIGEKKSNGGTQYYQQDRIYDGEGIAMCHPANIPGGSYKYAFKEENTDKIKKLGNYSPSGHNAASVVDTDGIAPTVMENHGTVTAVPIKNATKQGYLLAEEGDGVDVSSRMETHRGTVQKGMTQTIKTTCENGVVVAAAQRGRENGQQYEVSDREYANAITTAQKDSLVANKVEPVGCELRRDEGLRTFADDCIGSLRTNSYCGDKCIVESKNGSQIELNRDTKQLRETIEKNDLEPNKPLNLNLYNRSSSEESQTLDTGIHNSQRLWDGLRIRKLTPKECWRLMGFSDEDIDNAIKVGMSNAQLYKQAGNSIVVNVLMEIFKQML